MKINLLFSKRGIILFIILALINNKSSAQSSCGCDVTLPIMPDGGIYFTNGNSGIHVTPGQKVCIQAGTYPYISLNGFVGTSDNPITIINCGGQVVSGKGSPYAYNIIKSRYFKFTGTGDPNTFYGFKADGVTANVPSGISIRDSGTDYEVDHFEAVRVEIGILAKINPADCDPGTWNDAWTIRNLSFHDNYIHNTAGEGFYIGHTSPTEDVKDCNGNTITVEPIKINDIKVYDNITDSTGWDGIQVAAAENADIYNNSVKNFGTANVGSQQAGIILGGKSYGQVYNNYVLTGTGNGIQIFGTANTQVYNNVVVNTGWDGSGERQDAIIADDRPAPNNKYTGLQVYIMNNTVVNPGRNCVHVYNSYSTMAIGNKVYNNLLVQPNGTSPYDNHYTDLATNLNVTVQNNISKPKIPQAKFEDAPVDNFHLLGNSPAVDAGQDLSVDGILTDIDGISREQGLAYDAGAYEFQNFILPVTSLDFSVKNNNDINIILWKTSTEKNCDHFNIERSSNGQQFESIGTTHARGNSASISNYTFTDQLPFKGINFYRLAITDKDGKISYSKIISITIKNVKTFNIDHISLSAKNNNLSMILNSNLQQLLSLKILDAEGRTFFSSPLPLQNGTNNINKSIPAVRNGVYFIKIYSNDQNTVRSVFCEN